MRTTFIALALLALFSLIPEHAAAQGCAWCTSPTTCELIDESAHDSCTVSAMEGCSSEGLCVIVDPTEEDQLVLSEAARTKADLSLPSRDLMTDEWGMVEFSTVDEDTMVLWSCGGNVAAVAVRTADGKFERVSPTEYRSELNLFAVRDTFQQ